MSVVPISAGPPRVIDHVETLASENPEMGLDEIERCLLGIDHAEMCSRLAAHWGLPPAMIEAIRYHHRPSLAEESVKPLAYAAHVAELISSEHAPPSLFGLSYPIDPEWPQWIQLSPDQLKRVSQDLQVAFADAMAFFEEDAA